LVGSIYNGDSSLHKSKGLVPFGVQNREKFWYHKQIFFSKTTGLNELVFGMEYPWDKDVQVCTNKAPGVINGHAPGDIV